MPFIIDSVRLGLAILRQFLIWAGHLGFVTNEYHVRRSTEPLGHPLRQKNWKIVFPGWSRFLRLHYTREREHGRVYEWL